MSELNQKDKAFLEMIAAELAADFKENGVRKITAEEIGKAKDAIHARMWRLLANEELKGKVSRAIGTAIYIKTSKELAVNNFVSSLNA